MSAIVVFLWGRSVRRGYDLVTAEDVLTLFASWLSTSLSSVVHREFVAYRLKIRKVHEFLPVFTNLLEFVKFVSVHLY